MKEVRLDNKLRREFWKAFKEEKLKQSSSIKNNINNVKVTVKKEVEEGELPDIAENMHAPLIPSEMTLSELRRELITRGVNMVGGRKQLASVLVKHLALESLSSSSSCDNDVSPLAVNV